jgi:alpha-L-arabinofuranosidase
MSTATQASHISGCFLNACLRHVDIVGMANFAPVVNSRGAIFTHKDGIVLRPTYHVFDLYANRALTKSVETTVKSGLFRAEDTDVPAIDAAMTCSGKMGNMRWPSLIAMSSSRCN